jgi:hypothetical protein
VGDVCAVSASEQIKVKQRECWAKFGREESTTLTAGKGLRFVDNMTFRNRRNECEDPEVMIWENECDVRDHGGGPNE